MAIQYQTALIVGSGGGLSAALARRLARDGVKMALAARNTGKLAELCRETGARAFACDAGEEAEVKRLFSRSDLAMGPPDLVIYNASYRARGALLSLAPADVALAIKTGAFGGFLVAQEAARPCCPRAMAPFCSPGPRQV